MAVGSGEVKPAFVHGHAAMPDMLALRGPVVMPDLMSRSRIDGPHVVGHSKEQNSIHQERRRFDLRALVGLKSPCQREAPHVARRNLREARVPPAGIVAVIQRPAIGGWLHKVGGVKVLAHCPHRIGKGQQGNAKNNDRSNNSELHL